MKLFFRKQTKNKYWWHFFSDFPVLQALLWAPSQRFWFLCSSFALGGLATKGLRLPGLKNDVHSTCWFFKQLCPQKIRTSRSPSALWGIGGRERRWGGVWSPSYQTLFLCLSLSLTLTPSLLIYLCLLPSVFFLFLFFLHIICLIEPNHSDLPECLTHFAWHVVEREPGQNNLSLKASVTSPRCARCCSPISQTQGYCSYCWFHCCVAI